MKKTIIILLLIQAFIKADSQNVISRNALGVTIKVPVPISWQKVDDEISQNIRPNQSTYNVISLYKITDLSQNLLTIYSDSNMSKFFITKEQFQKIKYKFENKFLPSLRKFDISDFPLDKILPILKQFYKNSPGRYDSIVANKELLVSQAHFSVSDPFLTSFNDNGFYYNVPVKVTFETFVYSFSIVSGYIRLNKHLLGISGSIETSTDVVDTNQFIQKIITLNPSL